MSEITRMVQAMQVGDGRTAEELLLQVYEKLRRPARWQMSREAHGQTLQATALVHKAWLRLVGDGNEHWEGRRHFFAAAAEAMRRILVDAARRKKRLKHSNGLFVPLPPCRRTCV